MNQIDHPRLTAREDTFTLSGTRIVLADGIFSGNVTVEDGIIVGLDTGPAPRHTIDLEGDYLVPGLVDIHTDHFEKHVYPRPHVRWDYTRAALAHDAQVIGAGVTTVFDSLCVGATSDNPERGEILGPMIDALEMTQAAGMLRAEHFLHLRCEITDPNAAALTAANIDRDIVKVISVMEHLPGVRQSRDLTAYVQRSQKRTGESEAIIRAHIDALIAEKAEIGARIWPQIVALAKARGLPLLSHDDTDVEHVDMAANDGVAISEFPCTLEAAREARARQMLIVAGAPNILRGGSQSGNVAVRDLLNEKLVDILASDYVPRSLLDAAFMISADPDLDFDLPTALRMVTKTPAEAAGLSDRGEIAIGKRADLLRVSVHHAHPFARHIWRSGLRVA